MLIASPRQQWLRERASMLNYTYVGCLVGSHHKLEVSTNGDVVVYLSDLKLVGF